MSQEDIPTQTQTQDSEAYSPVVSQPMEKLIWGRLYAKNLRISTLGTKNPTTLIDKKPSHYYDLCNDEFSVGRNESNDLYLNKDHLSTKALGQISKIHFTISRDLTDLDAPAYITDRSRNGTFINGIRIGTGNKFILKNEDVISLSRPENKSIVYMDQMLQKHVRELPEEIRKTYYVGRKLGSGACGVVHLVYDGQTCNAFAMKHVEKQLLNNCSRSKVHNDPRRVMNEVDIMKNLRHPCVIQMHNIIDTPKSVYMVLEYMKGGDLLTRITSNKFLPEKTAKLYFLQMCYAVKYLHAKGITHRDLKPDNILLENTEAVTLLKVSDFGLSKLVQNDSVMRTLCGTPLYVAPEVLITGGRGSYTQKVDIWSLGVVLFTMLSGTVPFSDEYGSPAADQIKKAKFYFRHRSWQCVSALAKDLILKILTVNPNERPTLEKILNSTWLRDSEVIAQAERLMKVDLSNITKPKKSSSDIENNNEHVFTEPPKKRRRNK